MLLLVKEGVRVWVITKVTFRETRTESSVSRLTVAGDAGVTNVAKFALNNFSGYYLENWGDFDMKGLSKNIHEVCKGFRRKND